MSGKPGDDAADDEHGVDPAAKRPKLAPSSPGSSIEGVVSPALLAGPSVDKLRQAYASATPYPHCVFDQPFDEALLRAVRDEIINNINATYKETDLFKVFQTGDFGNLAAVDAEVAAKIPSLMRLKAALYSDEFRSFVRAVTGCGELSGKTDCSCNVYAQGGHLLCHDDVISTRCVSWIIYLTDPDERWEDGDGGSLELYPLEAGVSHTPSVHPTVCHPPTFNTMAMFTVLPGKSFHSVQEVFSETKPRMSISGWYHAPQKQAGSEHASLQQLQTMRAGQDLESNTYEPFADGGAPEGAELSDEDLALLVKYVNPSYLNEEAWPKIQAKFEEEGSVQLQSFLKKSVADRILDATTASDRGDQLGMGQRPAYDAGLSGGWRAVGPPHKQRFLRYHAGGDAPPSGPGAHSHSPPGALLAEVRAALFASGAFSRLLRKFTTLGMVGHRGEVRRFRPGLDYTVAHYGILTKDPRLDVVLCFVDTRLSDADSDANEAARGAGTSDAAGPSSDAAAANGSSLGKQKKGLGKRAAKASGGASSSSGQAPAVDGAKLAAWDAGEVGGFEAYLLAEDDKDSAGPEDTYRTKDDESGVLNVSAAANSLNLVLRDEGLMRFVKYVSYAAPSSRWDVAMEYLPEPDSDDEEAAAAHTDGDDATAQ